MNYKLTIGWLYPDLMSIYGDRGNIIALTRRCEWRGIIVQVNPIYLDTPISKLKEANLLFMGGAQDRQQTIVAQDLQEKKQVLSEMIEDNVPGLYICGGFQFLGKYYKEADGTIIEQLGILDVWTENPGGKRLIGNIAIKLNDVISNEVRNLCRGPHIADAPQDNSDHTVIIGFENHGGRTRLGPSVKPLGRVIKGYGSNAEDHTEGAVYKNSIGTYLHGPILPKNPVLTDWLIQKALERKYQAPVVISNIHEKSQTETSRNALNDTIVLASLNDMLAQKAHDAILKRM